MKNIQEWLKDKPILLALTSLQWAYIAPQIYEILCALEDKKIKEKLPTPPIDKWIEIYESPSTISIIIEMIKDICIPLVQMMGVIERSRVSNNEGMEIKRQAIMTIDELNAHQDINNTQDNAWLRIHKTRLDIAPVVE